MSLLDTIYLCQLVNDIWYYNFFKKGGGTMKYKAPKAVKVQFPAALAGENNIR